MKSSLAFLAAVVLVIVLLGLQMFLKVQKAVKDNEFKKQVTEASTKDAEDIQHLHRRLSNLEGVNMGRGSMLVTMEGEISTLKQQVKELRWEIDDLKLRNRSPEELDEATKASKDNPSAAVVVSEDYPKWRLPYGVKLDDKRPPEVVAKAIERTKAGKGIVYMWLSFPRDNGKELRLYMDKIDWKEPSEAENAKAETQ